MKHLLAAGLFTSALTLSAHSTSIAAPVLTLACALPNHNHVVLCRLTGRGFKGREHLRITYLVSFLALPAVHGKVPQTAYRRVAFTSIQGSFARPALGFRIIPRHESYRLTATVTGAAGDRARTSFTAIAQ
jgi:hypothetical protein